MKLLRTTHFRCGVILGRRWLHRRKAYVIWEGRGAQGSSRQLWPPVLTENKLSKSWLCLFKSLRFNVINNGEPPPLPAPSIHVKRQRPRLLSERERRGKKHWFWMFCQGTKDDRGNKQHGMAEGCGTMGRRLPPWPLAFQGTRVSVCAGGRIGLGS